MSKYIVRLTSSDDMKRDIFFSIVGKDPTKKFLNGKWSISPETYKLLIESIGETNLEVESDIEIGSLMKLNLYDYQKDIVKFCLEKKNAIIAAACGAGRNIAV